MQRKHARSLRQPDVDAVFGHYGLVRPPRLSPFCPRKIVSFLSHR
jgi:hypothetical protein